MRFFMIWWKQSLHQWLHWGLLTWDEMRRLKRLILFSMSLNLDCRSLEKRHLILHSTQAVCCLQGSTGTVRIPFEPFYGQPRLHKIWIPFQQISGWRPASWKRIKQSLLQITSKRLLGASKRSAIRLPHTRYSPYCVVYLGIFETHLMQWIIRFLKKYKGLQIFAIWKSLAVYPGYSASNKEKNQISQWTGKELRNIAKVIRPCFAASLRLPNAM